MKLETGIVLFIITLTILVTGSVVYVLTSRTKGVNTKKSSPENTTSIQMQLQAYERLILLVDRIALPNLISRLGRTPGSAKEMQVMLSQAIKEEFNYNITQHIYVSADAWTAVKNLKEQNLLIINQFANVLPPNATGLDLNKLLLEYLMNDKKGSLHEVVSEVLSYEAKKIL